MQYKDKKTGSQPSKFSLILTVLFCVMLAVATLVFNLPLFVAYAYLALSMICFIAYAIDKSAARKGKWRTKESTLHLLALLGGWPGAFYAQKIVRHKSSKVSFKRIFGLTVLVNVSALIAFVVYFYDLRF